MPADPLVRVPLPEHEKLKQLLTDEQTGRPRFIITQTTIRRSHVVLLAPVMERGRG